MNRSFVLGNGVSRKHIEPSRLKPHGLVYGCNALYREFAPDFLIAVDPKMVFEIQKCAYQRNYQVWTNLNPKFHYDEGFNYFTPSLGWSSGPSALQLAASKYPDEIYIFGFDFAGIDSFFNNVYSDTHNYKASTDIATYWGNWEKQTEIVIKRYPTVQFYRVIEPSCYTFSPKVHNFKTMEYAEFLKHITTW